MRFLPVLAALCLSLSSCGADQQPDTPPAVPVEAITVKGQPIPNVLTLPGRIEAVREAEVLARVTGIVQSRLFREGTNVSEGQPLFRIDQSELRASFAETQASLERARATAANARAVVQRYRPLVEENAISGQEFDAAVAASREANAVVAQTEAQLRSAGLQLGYTTVRAPIAGRVGRAQVTEGALVSQSEGTLLTRIEQLSPVYVVFSLSVSETLKYRQAIDSGSLVLPEDETVEVRLQFADGTEYPLPGIINFLDQSVNPTTGTVALRAEFANPEGLLHPGQFVRGRISVGHLVDGIAVPQRAVTVGKNGGTVYIIDEAGNAAVRQVVLGDMVDGRWIIQEGLLPGDAVITSNLQRLRPGAPVKRQAPPAGGAARKSSPSAETATAGDR